MEQKAQSLHFLQISHRTDLASKDMGILKDAMDIRGFPPQTWDSTSSSLKPAMASTVVARNLECWSKKLKGHVEAGTLRKNVLKFFPLILIAIKYMTDICRINQNVCEILSISRFS